MDTEFQCVSLNFEYKLAYTKQLGDATLRQYIVTDEGVGACYRRNLQQYLLVNINIKRMEPGFLNDAKMREKV